MTITNRDIIYQLIKNPLNLDPNYNKSLYHVYMGAKILAYVEYLIFSYDITEFIKNLNDFFRFLIQYSTVIEEFPSLIPIIVTSIEYIRTNPILFSEQTTGFQLSRQLMDCVPGLKAIIYTPIDYGTSCL